MMMMISGGRGGATVVHLMLLKQTNKQTNKQIRHISVCVKLFFLHGERKENQKKQPADKMSVCSPAVLWDSRVVATFRKMQSAAHSWRQRAADLQNGCQKVHYYTWKATQYLNTTLSAGGSLARRAGLFSSFILIHRLSVQTVGFRDHPCVCSVINPADCPIPRFTLTHPAS